MKRKFPVKHSTTGFTLIELIAVMVMIGVLFSIAAPGWLAFSNRQRVNSVRDEILQEIRRTQSEATRSRRHQTFQINTEVDPPTMQIEDVDSQPRVLGKGQIEPGMIEIEARNNIREIHFDNQGNLINADGSPLAQEDLPLKFIISLATNANTKGCVSVESLLGATKIASGADCN